MKEIADVEGNFKNAFETVDNNKLKKYNAKQKSHG